MNSLEIIKEFESKNSNTKNKILKYVKGMLKQSGFMKPTDDRVYKEIVNSYTTWRDNK